MQPNGPTASTRTNGDAMILVSRRPQPALATLVEQFWYCAAYAPPHASERVLPTGTVQLIIKLGSGTQPSNAPLVCGPRSTCSIIDSKSQSATLGVHFKPGGAYPFLGLPLDELHNTNLSLEALWGRKANELYDRLLEAKSPTELFEILERLLIARTHSSRCKSHPAVALALREFHRVPHEATIAEVAELAGLSARHFIQRFREEVGVTPKLHCRIRRFQTAMNFIRQPRQVDWTNLAMSCGYYDQAHFINEFRMFSGLTPTEYLWQKGEHLNHVAILD